MEYRSKESIFYQEYLNGRIAFINGKALNTSVETEQEKAFNQGWVDEWMVSDYEVQH
jgi:hypothetical protein